MTREHGDLLNRIGMGLSFVSFWLVTPEFIGEVYLRTWEKALADFLSGMGPALKRTLYMFGGSCAAVVAIRFLEKELTGHMLIPSLPQGWPVALMGLAGLSLLIEQFGPPLVRKLAIDGNVRRRFLLVGAFLFTVASVLQFWATYQDATTH
jgi:hypothetical protein